MTKKLTPKADNDLTAFHEAMQGTNRLKTNKIRLAKPSLRATKKKIHYPEESLDSNEACVLDPVRSEEFISYKTTSVSNKILRNLRKGQYNVEAKLDLHNMTVEEAKVAVDSFLQQCLHQQIKVALIIHGKGHHSKMPVLKNKLNHWLRSLKPVLAFCSASNAHGNRGAVYVLLKRDIEEHSWKKIKP